MQIRVLGPVDVVDGDRAAALGGPRPRTLIGALALCAPEIVSRDTLAEGVWDTRLPPGAAKTLRAHVAHLRRRLVAGGFGELVVTRAPGYALAVPVERIDGHLFQDLVGRARAMPVTQRRADTLRAALGLWRGEVLAGCPAGEWVRAEATRLQELRLLAAEELLAAELALGRHTEVAAELESLVARYPLRERLWELLMRALYYAGRRGDALLAYRRARSRLVGEIGVEPGAELRRLEAAILAGEPVLDGSGGPTIVTRPHPPAAGGRTGSGTVPTPPTTLIGRQAEITELAALLVQRRLITLTGVGGCGKTRLAIAIAERVAGRFTGGVRFVDLAALADPGLVAGTVAAGFELPDVSGGGAAALADSLRGQDCLLVLDNCEHVVHACAELTSGLLRSCPDLRVLATSRVVLGVPGETTWPVPPLPTPPAAVSGAGRLAEVSRYDAVRLFLDRAAVAVTRELSDDDAPDVAALCARLDGLPLAIELAAARTTVLNVAEIAGRLHDPAMLRTACTADRPHHRAMHTTIAWSYNLLDRATQDRFRRLAVFAGGFTLAAAEAVWRDPEAVDLLADLVAKSLVVVQRTAAGTRYRLLETIGRFAAARLAECPDTERTARARHAGYFLALAEDADRQLHRPDTAGWLARLAAEHENLRSALAWFGGAGRDPVRQLRLAVTVARYCQLTGRYGEGRGWLEQALAGAEPAPAALVGHALWATAAFATLTCDYDDAQRVGGRALDVHRRSGDVPGEARTLRLLASVARERGDYACALAELDRAADLVGADDVIGRIAVLDQIGFTCWLAGDLDRAGQALTEALQCCEQVGDPVGQASARTQLAMVAFYRGQFDLAGRLAADGLARSIELDSQEGIGWALNVIGLVALRQGNQDKAISALHASLQVHCAIGDRWRQASVIDALAAATLAAGDPVRAAELSGLADATRTTLGVAVPAQERPARQDTHAALCRSLPDDDRRAATARGATLRPSDVLTGFTIQQRPAPVELPGGNALPADPAANGAG